MCQLVDINDVEQARGRICDHIHRTPVLQSRTLNRWLGAELFFKCENFQRAGAFKFRGALNAVLSLTDEQAVRGVVTHSSGNHGSALALAASLRGVKAYVVMPVTAVGIKRQAAADYGAVVIDCEPTLRARESRALDLVRSTGANLVHPYNDPRIISGQGTLALELLEQVPDLDVLVVPVGGGGLLSGTAVAAKSLNPRVTVLGAEPLNADDARRSMHAGYLVEPASPKTIADGLRAGLGDLTFELIRCYADDILTASEEGITRAMRILWERMKIVVEPSAAVPLAALFENRNGLRGKRIAVVLSGGNADMDHLPWSRRYVVS